MEYIKNIFKGVAIGISNIIPGVSAGTIAVVMGIYDKLINSISSFFKDVKGNFKFLFFIGIGVLGGIIFFSKGMSYLLDKYPWEMNYLFMGLIAGTFSILFKVLKSYNPSKKHFIFFIITFLLLLIIEIIGLLGFDIFSSRNDSIIMFILGGFCASSAMILPGISGSFILVLFGIYGSVVTAVSEFNLSILIPFGVGVLLGLLCMVKIVHYLLKNFIVQTYMGIVGLVVGSLFSILPGFEFSIRMLFCIALFIIGFLISFYVCKLNKEN